MSVDGAGFVEEINFRSTKCRQHLARARLALLLSEVAATSEQLAKHHELVRSATGPTDDPVARVNEALTRSLFLDLKVNFELFLWTVCRAWLTHDLTGAMRRVTEATAKSKTLKEFIKTKSIVDLFGDVEAFIPAHGLELLTQLLGAMTPGSKVCSGSFWPQIKVAFAVRHLVEHRNGRVDQRFVGDVSSAWRLSSWGASKAQLPSPGERVQVGSHDFDATYEAMERGVEEIRATVSRGWMDRNVSSLGGVDDASV